MQSYLVYVEGECFETSKYLNAEDANEAIQKYLTGTSFTEVTVVVAGLTKNHYFKVNTRSYSKLKR